jgi:6-phosphogluconolactonase (cycloisomerase 2 family)
MRLARKSAVAFLSVTLMSIWLAGCGPTNDLPPLTGEFLYVSNAADGVVSEFSINTGTGQLSFLSQFTAESGANLRGIAIHPSNEFLYVDASYPGNVVGLDIGDGPYSGLIFLSNGTVPAADGPTGIAASPDGACVYATNFGGTGELVSSYWVNFSTGALTPVPNATVGQNPLGVAVSPLNPLMVLVVNRFSQSVSDLLRMPVPLPPRLCQLFPNGTLNLATTVTALLNSTPEFVAFHPTLPYAYVTDDGLAQVDEIGVNDLSISLLGAVKPNPSGELQPAPFSIVVHPSGNFLYTGSNSNGIISEFTIGATGLLTWEANQSNGVNSPISLAIDSSGMYLYAANITSSTISMFAIDQTTGALTPIGKPNTISAESPPNPSSEPFSIVTTH